MPGTVADCFGFESIKSWRISLLIRQLVKRFGSLIFHIIPRNHPALYHLCQAYVNSYNGENNDDIHSNGELRFMREMLVNCHIVFDVGANVGEYAVLVLGINPGLQLHCFEPSGATFPRLLARRFPPNVICNNFGLSSVEGERTLYVFADGAGINSLYRRHGLEDGWGLAPQQRTESVRLDTIDHYCENHSVGEIDYLKVDVEGHELEVFKGALEMLEQGRIKILQFEYGGCNIDARVLLKDLFEFLQPFGYVLHKIYPQYLRRIDRYDQRLENFQYQNWVAILGG